MNIQDGLQLFQNNPVISWHEHIQFTGDPAQLDVFHLENSIEIMERFGIERMVISRPSTMDPCTPEVFVRNNNLVYEAIKRYPDKLEGMAFIDGGFKKEAIYELERCVKELGFRGGVKLYNQHFMCDDVMNPIIEKCIELDIPITMHCAHVMDPGTKARQPKLSDGVHMAKAAKRYPEATFVMAHIGGGGDWKWSLKAIEDIPNVFTDVGGSVHDRVMIEETVSMLGAERVLFATDGHWSSGIGKLLGAEIPEEDKVTILSGKRFQKYLERQECSMLIDISAYVGHWPFRHLKYNTLNGLDKIATEHSVTHMLVSNINGFFYKDANAANLELLEELESYQGETKFLPFAIVNPSYPAWEKDAREMIQKGFVGFELAPLYHRYGLPKEDGTVNLEPAKRVFDLAEELQVPIRICAGIENFRGRNENDIYLNVRVLDYMELLSYNASVPVFATSLNPLECGKEMQELLEKRGGVYFDTTQFGAFRVNSMNVACERVGKEHICFGSLSPFNYMEVALLRTQFSKEVDFNMIKTNPAKALKLDS